MTNKDYIINFKANGVGFDKIFSELKQLKETNTFTFSKQVEDQIKKIEIMIPSLLQYVDNILSKNDIEFFDIKSVQNNFNKVSDMLESLTKNMFSSLNLEASKQLEKIQDKISQAEKSARSLQGTQSGTRKKIDPKSSTGLAATETNIVYQKESKKFDKDIGIDPASITTYSLFIKKVQELTEQSKLSQEQLENINSFKDILAKEFVIRIEEIKSSVDSMTPQIKNLWEEYYKAQQALTNFSDSQSKSTEISEDEKKAQKLLIDTIAKLNLARNEQTSKTIEAKDANKQVNEVSAKSIEVEQKKTGTLAKATKQVITYGTVLRSLRKIYTATINTITEMDKALTGMAVVTTMSRDQAWELVGSFQSLARQTGKTSSEIAAMATKFYQQGKSTQQVLKLTEAAAKAATIAGIDGSQSIDLLTNAMNGFQISASKAMEVSDKFAALAATAATDYEELATALSKVAAQANLAGLSMDFTLGLLTKGIEVTREAPETIGTALKTVIARMRELTDYGKTLEDGMDVNRVAVALNNIGVELMDEEGQFRDLESVITEVGKKWDTLTKNQQANVAVALAGTRQQSRLIAMMQDFDRTLELVDASANSYGATLSQQSKYMQGLEASTTLLSNAWQEFITNLTSSEVFINIINTLTQGLTMLANNLWGVFTILGILGAALLINKVHTTIMAVEAKKLAIAEKDAAVAVADATLTTKKNDTAKAKNSLTTAQSALQIAKANLVTKKATLTTSQNTLANLKNQLSKKGITAAEKTQINAQIAATQATIAQNQAEVTKAELEVQSAEANVKSAEFTYNSAKAAEDQAKAELNLANMQKIQTATSLIGIVAKIAMAVANKIAAKGVQAETVAVNANTVAWYANPIFWIVAVIVAVVAAIAVLIAMFIKWNREQKTTAAVLAETDEKLNQLQADLYNLNNASQSIGKLGDEFEELSGKIVKTSDDLARLNEIAQSVNDTFGSTVVDTTATYEAQLQQIRAAELRKQNQAKMKRQEINKTLGTGLESYQKAAGTGYGSTDKELAQMQEFNKRYKEVNGFDYYSQDTIAKKSKIKDKATEEYVQHMQQGVAGRNAIRSLGAAEIQGLDTVDADVKNAVLEMLVADFGNVLTGEGIDFDKFAQQVNGDFIQSLDKVYKTGKMSEYANFYKDLSDEQKSLLKQTMPLFEAFDKIGIESAKVFDSLDFKKEEINSIWDSLVSIDGQGAANTFAELMNDIGNMSGSEADKKREIYKKLVEEQRDFAMRANKVVAMTEQELNAQVAQGNIDAINYQSALKKQKIADDAAYAAELEAQNAKKDKNESDENFAARKKKLDDAATNTAGDAQKATAEVNKYKNATENAAKEEAKLADTMLNIKGFDMMAESITKLTSTMERLNKVNDLTSLSMKEQAELLKDYPELLGAMNRGYLTAADSLKLYQKEFDKIQSDLSSTMTDISVQAESNYDVSKIKGFDNLFGKDNSSKKLREELLQTTIDKDSELVKQLQASLGLSQEESIERANKIKDAVKQYGASEYIYDQNVISGIAGLMDGEVLQLIEDAKDEYLQLMNSISAYNTELERLDENSEKYKETLLKRNQSLLDSLPLIQKELKKLDEEAENKLGEKIFDTDGAEKSIKDVVKYVNGVAQIDKKLYDELDATSKNLVDIAFVTLNELAKKEADFNKTLYENREALAQSYIDIQSKETQSIIDNLEKRKSVYEKYYEDLDSIQEDQDREVNRESLLKQISALSGAVDNTSKTKLKSLQEELNNLNKEDLKAQVEKQRNALLTNLDTEIEKQNEYLESINNSLKSIVDKFANPNEQNKSDIQAILAKLGIELDEKEFNELFGYSKGGLVTTTGPVMVHGTKNNPEAFLSSSDRENIQILLDTLKDNRLNNMKIITNTEPISSNSSSNISIENIIIKTENLNNSQDFKAAGRDLASEFAQAIQKRGININVKK